MIESIEYTNDKINKVIDKIESYLFLLVVKNQLKGVDIKKNERDSAPDILFNWQEEDLINRSIHIMILNKGKQIKIACNAWKDYKIKNKKEIMRKWNYQNIIEQITLKNNAKIKEFLNIAYQTVSEWKEKDLAIQEPIYF